MKSFIRQHAAQILGSLSGLDRVRFRGTLRWLANLTGMRNFLSAACILFKDFKPYALDLTQQIREHAEQVAKAADRPMIYLESSAQDKEVLVREIAQRDRVRQGLITVLSCVELCRTYKVGPNRQTKKLELRSVSAKCLHLYFYYRDAEWGWMHARLQTWFPFTIHVCLNGRECLARQMDRQGIRYLQRDNCFPYVSDVPGAQALLEQQLQMNWPQRLSALAAQINPVYRQLYPSTALEYYWSADETEWATDVLFRRREDVQALYPALVHHGLTAVSSADVMRFLGKRVPAHGGVEGHFEGEVVTDLKQRPEGIRIKHRVNSNSLKLYDKQGTVLRVETTINDARDMKSYRPPEGDPQGKKQWRRLRKGVADLQRRCEVSQAANERYLESLATVEATTPVGELLQPLCQPVRWHGKRVRALNPLNEEDASWLAAVNRGEFLIKGFRNKDLRAQLFQQPASEALRRRQAAKVTRILRLLRAHRLIRKVSRSHSYQVTDQGRLRINALLAVRGADAKKLTQLAA